MDRGRPAEPDGVMEEVSKARRFDLREGLTGAIRKWPIDGRSMVDQGDWYTPREMPDNHEITRLLQAWSDGDGEALEALIPMVFQDLHRLAHHFFQREAGDHTLQPTALVSELYLRLRDQKNTEWTSRKDFFNFAAEVMRHLLVDWARRRNSGKRGAGAQHISLDLAVGPMSEMDVDLVALSIALDELSRTDPRQAKIVELRFFVGLTVEETAEALGISTPTVKREWRTAKFWLHHHLHANTTGAQS